ncbi:MAG: hypothetical protein AAGB02_03055 [Pseudomonadota bacterium]
MSGDHWQTLTPGPSPKPITVKIAHLAKGTLRLTLNEAALETIGAPDFVEVAAGGIRGKNMIKLSPCAVGERAFKIVRPRNNAVIFITNHPFMIGFRHGAEPCAVEQDGGSLIITCPDWAALGAEIDAEADDAGEDRAGAEIEKEDAAKSRFRV